MAVRGSTCLSFGVTYEGLKPAGSSEDSLELGKFWSYLWGFETSASEKSKFYRVGFGVTYEGLKLSYAVPNVNTFGSFGVTYEGLKQQNKSEILGQEGPVLELPMRVWNTAM